MLHNWPVLVNDCATTLLTLSWDEQHLPYISSFTSSVGLYSYMSISVLRSAYKIDVEIFRHTEAMCATGKQ